MDNYIDPFQEELRFLLLKAKCSEDDLVLLGHLLKKIKDLHKKYEEKMEEDVETYIQKQVDRLMKEIPQQIHKKQLELKIAKDNLLKKKKTSVK